MSLILSFCIFYLSFTPLWISVVFVDIMSIVKCSPTIWTEKISIVLILIVFILSMLFLYFGLKGRNGDNVEKYTLKSAYEEKSITVEYLLSYILPLFAFDFTTWEGVALFAIFFATLGFLCIKHSFFCVNIVLGQFTRNYTQTVKRAADNKRRYAPGKGHSACLLWGYPKGAAPHLAHDFAKQSVVCYTLCRRCRENAVAAGEGKGI